MDPRQAVVGFGLAWMGLLVISAFGYAIAGRDPPDSMHNLAMLPFVAVGDLLNAIARRRYAAMLGRVQDACAAGRDYCSNSWCWICWLSGPRGWAPHHLRAPHRATVPRRRNPTRRAPVPFLDREVRQPAADTPA